MRLTTKALQLTKSLAAGGVIALAMAGFSGAAQAVAINGTEVGAIDTLLGAVDSPNSGLETEEALLESFIGSNVELVENVDIDNGDLLVGGGLRAIDVSPDEPGYFVLKFGTGNTGNDMFFFANLIDLNYLVWSDAQLIAAGLPDNHVQSISHYAITTGTPPVLPEPGSLALVGVALAGLGLSRRRQG